MDDQLNVLLPELRRRLDQINFFNDEVLFYEELVRIVKWIQIRSEFEIPLKRLQNQRIKKELEISDIAQQMKVVSISTWSKINKDIKVDKKILPIDVQHEFALLIIGKDKPEQISAINYYHALRRVVESLANLGYQDKLKPYIRLHPSGNVPLISGKPYELFLTYMEKSELLSNEIHESDWGAWSMLIQLEVMYMSPNRIQDLKDWYKAFGKEKYLIYAYRIADYIFDYIHGKDASEPEDLNIDKYKGISVWEPSFIFTEHRAIFGEYGTLEFYPEKSGYKKPNVDKPSGTSAETFFSSIFKYGSDGVSEKSLKAAGLDDRGFKRYTDYLNDRLYRQYTNGMLGAYIEIIRYKSDDEFMRRIAVIPKEIYEQLYSPSLSPSSSVSPSASPSPSVSPSSSPSPSFSDDV